MVSPDGSSMSLRPLSPSSRLSPSTYPSSKSCSPRRQAFAARELDPLLANLSPLATLEALKASNAVDDAADSRHRLLTNSIAGVSQSERALGIRAAVAGKKLREWYSEVRAWKWPSRQFEPPALSQMKKAAMLPSHNGSIDQALASDQFVDDRYDMTYWGSLPAETVQEYDGRLEEIQDGLDALDIEDLKSYIRKAHLLTSKGSENSLSTLYSTDSSSSGYNKLDDFTVVITATIMQALPYLSRLSTLIELWHTRLLVLRQVPIFLHQLEDAQTAMRSAIETMSGSASELTRDSYLTMKDVLGTRTTALAQTLDNMLDVLEGRPDTVPDHWIDDMEDVERAYQNWVADAEEAIMANELDELRSLKVDSPRSDEVSSQPTPALERRTSSATDHSQSDATAVGEEEPSLPEKRADSPRKARKQRPGSIDLSAVSGWAETEAIKIQAAHQLSRRSSFSYSDISEEPEVIQTSQVQYVSLSPTVSSPGIKPSLIEISSRSSKHSSRSSEPASPVLVRSVSGSTHGSNQSHELASLQPEAGVAGPPAVFAPWPPRKSSSHHRATASRPTTANLYEAYYESSDSEAEGGLRSYGSSNFGRSGHGRASDARTPHTVSPKVSNFDRSHTGPSLTVDDFFTSIVQPLSDSSSPVSRPTTQHSQRSPQKQKITVPPRESSHHTKSSRSKVASRAVSPSPVGNIEAQLNSRISTLLNRIPASIRFFSGPEDDATEIFTAHTPNREHHPSPSILTPQPPTSLKLAPAPSAVKQTAASASRSAQSEVKLYHLHQPGRLQPIKLYVRLVGENGERVMVRVGGGWSDLGEYLHEYAAHHGRYATIDAGGADLELKDIPVPSSSAWGTSRATSGTHHSSRSESPAISSRTAGSGANLSASTSGHIAKSRRYFSSSTSLASGSQNSETASLSGSAGQIKVSKARRSISHDFRPGAVTPPHQVEESPFALGPAGPAAKPKDISPKKKAWVEGVMSQARKVSGGGTKLIRVEDYVDDRPSTSGSTRRVYLRNPSQAKMKGREW